MKDKVSKKIDGFFAGKGFYIALFICVAIIGVTSWTVLFSGGKEKESSAVWSPVSSASEIRRSSSATKTLPSSDTGHSASLTEISPKEEIEEPVTDVIGEAAEVSLDSLEFIMPVSGRIVGDYSMDELVFNETLLEWRAHNGIDIAAERGTKVLCAAPGTVSAVKTDSLLGTTVIVDHGGGIMTCYSNLAETPAVKEGDFVDVGVAIGSVGMTAIGEANVENHLHFSILSDGKSISPVDYLPIGE